MPEQLHPVTIRISKPSAHFLQRSLARCLAIPYKGRNNQYEDSNS